MGTWASASLTFLIAMRVRTTMGVDRIRLICACFPLVILFFFKKRCCLFTIRNTDASVYTPNGKTPKISPQYN